MIQKHPENDLPHDENKVDTRVVTTVGDTIIEHQESGAARGSGDGLGDAGEAVGQRSMHDAVTLPEAEPASGDRDAGHEEHRPTISARRASSRDAGDDAATVKGTVGNEGHLSGIELVGIESSRNNPPERDSSPESSEQNHLSGTIPPFANVRRRLKKPSKSYTLDAGSVASVRQCLLAPHGSQCHLRFECSTVMPACPLRHLISGSAAILAACGKKLHLADGAD